MSQYTVNLRREALVATTAETVLQVVAGANKPLALIRWGVGFNGVTPPDSPVQVDLLRLTSAGTSSAFTPLKMDPYADASMATARTAHTAEPTYGDVLESYEVTPYGGLLVMQYAFDERPRVAINGRLGIRCIAAANVSCTAFLVFDE
jgi:hypothetical protein